MKNLINSSIVLLLLAASLSGCTDRTMERITYSANVPVYMSFTEFRNSFIKTEPAEMSQPGKIYFKDNYLFVNEVGKGIHVIDNSNPAHPEKISFYKILGNVDMAIRGNILYADSFIDLVAIDITDINNPVEVGRLKNIFPAIVPEGDKWYPYSMVDKASGVVVAWEVNSVTEERERGSNIWRGGGERFYESMMFNAVSDGGTKWSAGAGTGGSMARFMLNGKYLYLISYPRMMKMADVEKPEKMRIVDSIQVSRDMETLYVLEDKMFVGTTTGMLIYDITDAVKPRQISVYNHMTACDPVVADGQYAYVTLRSGTRCNSSQNLLDIIDISSISNPYRVKSYPMFNPYGLGVDGKLLFVCDGRAGLKIYDKSDPLNVINNKLAHYPDFFTFDVIPMKGTLMLTGEDGIYQYNYSNPQNIVQLSHIPIINDAK